MTSDDERWRRHTLPADAPAVPTASGPTVPEVARAGVLGRGGASPFDPPRRDRFEEKGELGRGGMGRVFEARDTSLDRPVAIKQSLTDDAGALARFEREARITAQLQHPGIVPIFDAGRDQHGRPYYIMRKVEGRPLAELISEARELSQRLALVPRILAAVEAVAYAHARGVIHRDLKSWNVLLGPFGETLVIDWGLARDVAAGDEEISSLPTSRDPVLTRAGQAYGTPGFMAPEQARGEPVDRRADVFALGAMLYHALSGKRPFEGISMTEVMTLAATPPPLELSDDWPPELVTILRKAMAHERADRYADAGELAEDLGRFTAGRLVAAHRYTARELLLRWLRRHRLAVSIAALAFVALVVGVVAVWRVIAARDRADAAFAAEADRADELLVERADGLLDWDPTHAVALLKQLRDDSPAWPRATAVYDSAAARGVARGLVAHSNVRSTQLIAASDGSSVISAAEDGPILAHDPALRSPPRQLARLDHPVRLAWIDEASIAVMTVDSGVHRVGLDGSVRRLDAGGDVMEIVAGGGRLFARAKTGSLREIDPGGGPVRRDVATVKNVIRARGALIYATADHVIFEPDGERSVVLTQIMQGTTIAGIAASQDGRRISVAVFGGKVTEWQVDAGVASIVGEWDAASRALAYFGSRLIAVESSRQLWLRPGIQPALVASVVDAWPVTAMNECGFLKSASELWMVCEALVTRIGGMDKLTTVVVAANHVIGATSGGKLLSWDLARLLPRRIAAPGGAMQPHGFGLGKLWLKMNTLVAVDDAGKATDLGEVSLACLGTEHAILMSPRGSRGVIDRRSAPAETLRVELLDKSLVRTLIADGPHGVICAGDLRRIALVFLDRVEIRDLANPQVVIAAVAIDRPSIVSLFGRWLAIVLESGELERVDLVTGDRIKIGVTGTLRIAVDASGRVAAQRSSSLAIWDGKSLVEVPVANGIGLRASLAGFVVTTIDKSLVVIERDQVIRTFQGRDGFEPSFAIDRPLATLPDPKAGFLVANLRDGSTRRIAVAATPALLSPDGEEVMGGKISHALIWRLTNVGPRELRARIHELTNATVAPGSTQLDYPSR